MFVLDEQQPLHTRPSCRRISRSRRNDLEHIMPDNPFTDPITTTIVAFLQSIGLTVRAAILTEGTFLPGIRLDAGTLLVDPARLRFPGDLLHEAGHLAVAAPERRQHIHGDAGSDAAEEMMAIGWSYAALRHLQLAPDVVFHAEGYRGGAASLIDNFAHGRYLGVPMLQWVGMTFDEEQARQAGASPYPHMRCWLRPG
jgi:hypothetical protein